MTDLDDLDAAYEQAQTAEPDVPPGEYIARLVSVSLTSASTQARGLRVRLAIEEGPHRGRLLRDDLWLNGGALPISKQNLETLGLGSRKPSEILAFREFAQLPRVLVQVKHEKHQGRTYVSIVSYRRMDPDPRSGDKSGGRP
jgi:hypothetical protein